MKTKKILVTGSAGFIGFHLSRLLLSEGFIVHGYDGMTDYYDVALKRRRQGLLHQNPSYSTTEGMLEDYDCLRNVSLEFEPDVIVHLAAQAGVRHSLEFPRTYIESNIVGTFNVMEVAKELKVEHLMLASTSSVYGANDDMPFTENEKADTQLTIYAATKKATESMTHAYAHLYKIPTTLFRFFTVYGTWGRPDLALYKFVDAMLDSRTIDIYNRGEMYRDFTYVDDLVRAIRLLVDAVPGHTVNLTDPSIDSLSPVAPHRIVNIGNSEKVKLLDFIKAIEDCLGIQAKRNYLGMQTGDVPATWADTRLLQELTGFTPKTNFKDGIKEFVAWYRDYKGR